VPGGSRRERRQRNPARAGRKTTRAGWTSGNGADAGGAERSRRSARARCLVARPGTASTRFANDAGGATPTAATSRAHRAARPRRITRKGGAAAPVGPVRVQTRAAAARCGWRRPTSKDGGGTGDVPTAKAETEDAKASSPSNAERLVRARGSHRERTERQEGSEAVVRRYGCRRGANLRRERRRGERAGRSESRVRSANAANPMTGTRVQQTWSPSPEQAVGAVRNREDGTRTTLVGSARRERASAPGSGRRRRCRWRGEEPQARRRRCKPAAGLDEGLRDQGKV
jgi:hypothetical protein